MIFAHVRFCTDVANFRIVLVIVNFFYRQFVYGIGSHAPVLLYLLVTIITS